MNSDWTSRYRMAPAAGSWAAYRSEASGPNPDFRLTPFYDRWRSAGALGNEARLGGIAPRGLVYAGVQRRIRLAGRGRARFACTVEVTPRDIAVPAVRPRPRGVPPAQAAREWRRFQATLPSSAAPIRGSTAIGPTAGTASG